MAIPSSRGQVSFVPRLYVDSVFFKLRCRVGSPFYGYVIEGTCEWSSLGDPRFVQRFGLYSFIDFREPPDVSPIVSRAVNSTVDWKSKPGFGSRPPRNASLAIRCVLEGPRG